MSRRGAAGTVAPAGPPSAGAAGGTRRFLTEVHGVRGVALGLVVAFHLFGGGRVSGGVDVFLVISAYLLTGGIDRALREGRFSLVARYARTFSGLLPAALLVLVAVGVAGLAILPVSRWEQLLREVAASALLAQNAELAGSGLAYGAAGPGASPLQHFWSLSVQGQFLLLWPLLAVVLAGVLALLRRTWSSALFAVVTGILTAASFAYAVHLVGVDQQVAYYSFPARAWEMGAGALAALVLARVRVAPALGGVLAWTGVALIVSSGFVVDGAQAFPGPWTLWPVLGTIAMLAGSESGGAPRAGLTRVLQLRPLTWLADIAYPLYLWHWPILVYFLAWNGHDRVGPAGAAGILVVSLLAAWATQRWLVDVVARRARRAVVSRAGAWRVLAALVAGSLVVGGAAAGGAAWERQRAEATLGTEADAAQHPGAAALVPGADESLGTAESGIAGPWDEAPVPAPEVAVRDLPDIYSRGCIQNWRDGDGLDEVLVCDDEPGTRTVVLSGGSHAVQFYPALREIADAQGWRLVVVDKDGCRLAAEDPLVPRRPSCVAWNEKALDVILGLHPDAVVTIGTETRSESGAEGAENVPDGQVAVWRQLSDAGVPVIALRDSPRFPHVVPECLQENEDAAACGLARSEVYAEVSPLEARADLPDDVIGIDLADGFCGVERCEPIVGNVVAYRDQSHLTATYARTLAPLLAERLAAAAPWLMPAGRSPE
ncbi:acyltransferase family protein [Microbacterium sp. No. 7]|uniref:acyltransferase family protein n=1 Tax=Microbacterium sp. No. 7 TaxID=1714373 RepID=UPI0006D06007|nr:acyltransferase family protein [Microbacterium sp. No. 7]ALJ19390.1 hypothetical protein AOA12_05515 [Microbacterium sp. No. 7]